MTDNGGPATAIAWQTRVPDWIRRVRRAHLVLGGLGVLVGGIGGFADAPAVLQAGLFLFGIAFLVLAVLEIGYPEACHHVGWGRSDRQIGITAGEWRLTTEPQAEPPTRQEVWLLRIQGGTYLLLAVFTFVVVAVGL